MSSAIIPNFSSFDSISINRSTKKFQQKILDEMDSSAIPHPSTHPLDFLPYPHLMQTSHIEPMDEWKERKGMNVDILRNWWGCVRWNWMTHLLFLFFFCRIISNRWPNVGNSANSSRINRYNQNAMCFVQEGFIVFAMFCAAKACWREPKAGHVKPATNCKLQIFSINWWDELLWWD